MTELEPLRSGIDANLSDLHAQQWSVGAGLLRQIHMDAPEAERVAATLLLDDHYDMQSKPETRRVALIYNAITAMAAWKPL